MPPTFDAMISAMKKKGTGLILSSEHSVSVTGPMSRTVVTLSRNADKTAVSRMNKTMIFQGSPFARWAHFTARHSKTPESFTTATNSIIPRSTPSVLKSRCPMATSKGMTCSAMSITAPTSAISVRWIFSETMRASATTNTTMEMI